MIKSNYSFVFYFEMFKPLLINVYISRFIFYNDLIFYV